MGLWQGRSQRKPTGGRRRPFRKKLRFEIAREQQSATVTTGPGTIKRYRVRGNHVKRRILTASQVNVYDPQAKTTRVVRIVTVRGNPANSNYVQQNILTRGAIVETELGLVQIRSRPGQDGILNGIRLPSSSSSA